MVAAVKPQKPVGQRVDVWNGDQSQYLGKGTYVGNVTVYCWMAGLGIQSLQNAEEKPTYIADKDIKTLHDNPKIIMDNGDVRYGCQVWWKEAKK